MVIYVWLLLVVVVVVVGIEENKNNKDFLKRKKICFVVQEIFFFTTLSTGVGATCASLLLFLLTANQFKLYTTTQLLKITLIISYILIDYSIYK